MATSLDALLGVSQGQGTSFPGASTASAAGAGLMLAGIPGAGWLAAGSQVLSAALEPSPTSAPSSVFAPANFDNSGWTVATGSGKASGGLNLSPWLILGVAFLGAVAWIKTKKR